MSFLRPILHLFSSELLQEKHEYADLTKTLKKSVLDYVTAEYSDPDSESSPLAWWKVHEVNFPLISRLAKKYLCIPATSTASERVFSAGGNVVTCHS